MAWGQAVAFQGTVAVVYPETDEPAYRVVFESVIQGIRNRIGPSQIQTYALTAATKSVIVSSLSLAHQPISNTYGRGTMIASSVGQRHPPKWGDRHGWGTSRGVFAQHLWYWFQYRDERGGSLVFLAYCWEQMAGSTLPPARMWN